MTLRLLRFLPDKAFGQLVHFLYHGSWPNLRSPKTFSEIIAAKKALDHNLLYTETVDRVAVREYVAQRIGSQYLIPLLQNVAHPSEINFDVLGDGGYVIKAQHGYNMNVIVAPGTLADEAEVLAQTAGWVTTNFYDKWKEWAYKDCPRGLVVEAYIGDPSQPPTDYKFHMFNGRVAMIQVDTDRFIEHKCNMFDAQWNELKFRGAYPKNPDVARQPENLTAMVELAEQLAAGMPFVRIDLYNVEGRIYFGEVTHYPGAGTISISPNGLDSALGDLFRFGTPLPAEFIEAYADAEQLHAAS